MKKLLLILGIILCSAMSAASQNSDVDKVLLIFKTHLDIGYTDFSFNVEKKYLEKFIPKAIETAQSLREEGGAMLEDAIRMGDIHWNAFPYTIESEGADRTLLNGMLELSAELDRRFGTHTVAAKMTDVPGHTRGIVPVLADKGIRMLHIGVNGCNTVPEVPVFFRWLDEVMGNHYLYETNDQCYGKYREVTVVREPKGQDSVE